MKRLCIVLVLVLFGCGKEKSTDSSSSFRPTLQETDAIIEMYYQWGEASRAHQYGKMLALSYPGANFEGMSKVCKQQWDLGYELYYTFSGVQIRRWDADGTPFVVGDVTMWQGRINQAPTRQDQTGFASGTKKWNGQWKLAGINDNYQAGWWR